ncbi:hypothetical protein [Glutamicibacter sp.]|uniref:hypothetical protein n=1 Tax=Glutamicibacter sp. TaxID=1931995 RepID=UPI002FE1A40C
MGANEKHAATYHGLSDDTVRGRYCDGTHAQTGHTTDGAEYDTWLARVKAEAKAEALNEAADEVASIDGREDHDARDWLRARANQYKEGADNGR